MTGEPDENDSAAHAIREYAENLRDIEIELSPALDSAWEQLNSQSTELRNWPIAISGAALIAMVSLIHDQQEYDKLRTAIWLFFLSFVAGVWNWIAWRLDTHYTLDAGVHLRNLQRAIRDAHDLTDGKITDADEYTKKTDALEKTLSASLPFIEKWNLDSGKPRGKMLPSIISSLLFLAGILVILTKGP